METDYSYIGSCIGALCDLPVRVYKGKDLIYSYSGISLNKDPILVYIDTILTISSRICYYITPDLYFYGIVNHEDVRIVLGPSRQNAETDNALFATAHKLGIPESEWKRFAADMKKLSCVPMDKAIQLLCMLNYFLNNEKLNVTDIVKYDSFKEAVSRELTTARRKAEKNIERLRFSKLYSLEQKMVYTIYKGDVDSLEEMRDELSDLSGNTLHESRLYFVISSAVAVRTAIKAGMDSYDAFTWNRKFVRECDGLTEKDKISALRYRMLQFFTNEVRKIRMGTSPSKLVIDTANYIREHISETIRTDQIAEALYLSRSHLSRKFKSEAGMTLSDFIIFEKAEEAKRMLRYTEKPISDISSDLGFSSQSHLIRVFRKLEGITPKEYRNKFNI
ncbi:MAG: helix-turn-helix domain-containing protein [Oscillospiraceae bacterium]|nr:helix-turn-helix domain-containing protein [Oscillospiraceae bacterium]